MTRKGLESPLGVPEPNAADYSVELTLASVRSSVARRLGIDPEFVAVAPRNVNGLLDIMASAAVGWTRLPMLKR